MPGKRQAGCRFLLGTSLLDKQKRSASAAAGRRKLLLYAQVSSQAYQPKCDACLRRHDGCGAMSAFAARRMWECDVCVRKHRGATNYSFLIACPPNSLRIEDSSLSANESSSRER